MKPFVTSLFVSFALLSGCATSTPRADPSTQLQAGQSQATIILTNAHVYSMDAQRSRAEAVALAGDRILAVGSNAEIAKLATPSTTTFDLHGAFVLPGFHDAHVHLVNGGVELHRCDLSALHSIASIIERLKTCATEQPSEWLTGSGWDLSLFPAGNPSSSVLDAVTSTRPIFLVGADGHSAWVNSAALSAARIGKSTPNPALGVIERAADGTPSGTLRESAMQLVSALLPPPDDAERLRGLRTATDIASRYGITSAIEASANAALLSTYREALAGNALPLRVVTCIRYTAAQHEETLALLRSAPHTGQVRATCAKIFVDGVLEGETAALIEPYLQHTDNHRGTLNLTAADLTRAVTALDADGVQVHMHAIGDGAVRAALDAVAAAEITNTHSRSVAHDSRHHIAHLQLVHPTDYPRFASLGVTANFQALWAFPDAYIRDINTAQVGAERVQRMYPIGSLLAAAANIVGGSDWSVSSMNPLDAIEVAVTRQDPDGRRPDVLNAQQRVSLDSMLAAYTIHGAWLMRQETEVGSIEPGKLADLVVLDRDLFEIPPAEINQAQVLYTFFGGRVVYGREATSP